MVKNTKAPRMLVLEFSEAEKHFLNKFVRQGKLPTLEKLLAKGKFLKTKISSEYLQDTHEKHLTPWAIWPSIYTGLAPKAHGIVGFGQDTRLIEGKCIWDKLNEKGITTGVFGSLMSEPVRRNPYSLFYLAGACANTSDCFPESLRTVQEYLSSVSKEHSKRSIGTAMKLLWQMANGRLKEMPFSLFKEILSQNYIKLVKDRQYQRNWAIFQAKLQIEIFQLLYQQYKPLFATLHLTHIASAQHLYWRAAEPEAFKEKLGDMDSYFFSSIEARNSHEEMFKDVILESFVLVDNFINQLLLNMDENTLLVIVTGFGQKKKDPVDEIHKPAMRLYDVEKLLRLLDVSNCEILSQMNPDITLNFQDPAEASLSAFKLSNVKVLGEYPLFQVEQIGNQLFLHESLPANIWFLGEEAWVENESNEEIFPLFDYIKMSRLKEQYTANHSAEGWILLYGNLSTIPPDLDTLDITEICPLLFSYFSGNLQR